MSRSESTGQSGTQGVANVKTDVGVVRATDAYQVSVIAVTDTGVPTNYPLIAADNQPSFVTDNRVEVNPQARNINQRGIGVPYNPNNGTTID